MGIPRSEDGTDQLVGFSVKDEQWMEHVLPEVAMVAAPFLLAMRWIIRAVEIEQDVVGNTAGGTFLHIELDQ